MVDVEPGRDEVRSSSCSPRHDCGYAEKLPSAPASTTPAASTTIVSTATAPTCAWVTSVPCICIAVCPVGSGALGRSPRRSPPSGDGDGGRHCRHGCDLARAGVVQAGDAPRQRPHGFLHPREPGRASTIVAGGSVRDRQRERNPARSIQYWPRSVEVVNPAAPNAPTGAGSVLSPGQMWVYWNQVRTADACGITATPEAGGSPVMGAVPAGQLADLLSLRRGAWSITVRAYDSEDRASPPSVPTQITARNPGRLGIRVTCSHVSVTPFTVLWSLIATRRDRIPEGPESDRATRAACARSARAGRACGCSRADSERRRRRAREGCARRLCRRDPSTRPRDPHHIAVLVKLTVTCHDPPTVARLTSAAIAPIAPM